MDVNEPYDPEKGPDHGAVPAPAPRNFRWIPKFMTIHLPDVQIDRKALEHKLRSKWLLVFLIFISIILSSIAIASCTNTSSAMTNAFLLEAKYDAYAMSQRTSGGVVNDGAYATMNSNSNGTDLAIRIGYFGTCVGSSRIKNATSSDWYCGKNVTTVVGQLQSQDEDPFNMVFVMNELRSNILSPVIFIMSVCISFIAIITLIAANIKNTSLFFISTGVTLLACFFALVALVWQQVTVDAAKSIINNLSQTAIHTSTGSVPAGLGWTSVLFLFFVSIGIVALVVNENQALIGLQEFGEDMGEAEHLYGQNAYNGRPVMDESAVNLNAGPKYPVHDPGAPNVTMPTPY